MVEGLAKAAIEGLVANLPGDQTPVTEPNPSSLEPERSSKRSSRETSSVRTSSGGGSRRGTREAQVAAPVKVIPGGSRRGTREVTVMAAIQEGEGEARVVPQVLNLAAQMVELGGTKRGAGRRGTNAKKVVTWDSEAAVPSAVRLAVPLAVPLTVLEEGPQKEIA